MSLNYTGQRLDSTGLLYYHARYYDPGLGRFVSPDTLVPGSGGSALTVWPSAPTAAARFQQGGKPKQGEPTAPTLTQALNRYSYVRNNPLHTTNPSGHSECEGMENGSVEGKCGGVGGGGDDPGGGDNPGEPTTPGAKSSEDIPEQLNPKQFSEDEEELIAELQANGVKFTRQNIVRVVRLSDGRIVFLEKGNQYSGLQHILEGHAGDFANRGISEDEIPDVIMQALQQGNIVGIDDRNSGGTMYEVTINGTSQYIKIVVGSNGYIVTAYPWSP